MLFHPLESLVQEEGGAAGALPFGLYPSKMYFFLMLFVPNIPSCKDKPELGKYFSQTSFKIQKES